MAIENKVADATFLTKDGAKMRIGDVISEEDDTWRTKDGVNVISHYAVKKLARLAGISKSYKVFESERVVPNYKNELEHIVRIKINCLAQQGVDGEGSCIHDIENHITITGEANRNNTSKSGTSRLRMMAEKRGYDIAVLEHIGIHSKALSEEESENFAKEPVQTNLLYDTDLENVATEINMLNACLDEQQLAAAAATIKEKAATGAFTEPQLEFLRGLHGKMLARHNKQF